MPDNPCAIDDLQTELNAAKDEIAAATSKANDLSAQIKVLQARCAEITKATASFSAGVAGEQQELANDKQVIDQKSKMVKAALTPDQVNAITAVVKSVDDDISKKNDAANKSQKAADKAKKDLDAAIADAKAKLAKYNSFLQTQKDIDGNLKDIKGLLTQAATAETNGDLVTMYFLVVNEATTAVGNVAIPTPDKLTGDLQTAQAEKEAANQLVADRQSAYDAATKDLSNAQTAATTANSTRRATILAGLKNLQAPAAAGPAVPAVPPVPVAGGGGD